MGFEEPLGWWHSPAPWDKKFPGLGPFQLYVPLHLAVHLCPLQQSSKGKESVFLHSRSCSAELPKLKVGAPVGTPL